MGRGSGRGSAAAHQVRRPEAQRRQMGAQAVLRDPASAGRPPVSSSGRGAGRGLAEWRGGATWQRRRPWSPSGSSSG